MRSPLAWLRERFAQSVILTRLVPSWQQGRELPTGDDLYRLIDEGYHKIILVYACVNQIATSVAEPRLLIRLDIREPEANRPPS